VTVENPTVSVVMAVRDGAAFLGEAVESVLTQTFRDLELIVVDDGSTDPTPEILADLAAGDERLHVLREPGIGVCRARNRACGDARGRYLAILDADDVALPKRLELQVAFLNAHPDVAVVGGSGIFIDDRGMEFGTAEYPSEAVEVARLLEAGRAPVMHSAATMRAEAFRATSGYRPIMVLAQDYDLWLRIAPAGRITNLPDPVVRYRIHNTQATYRNLTMTAACVRAALATAKARANGEADLLDGVESLDATALELLGVQPEEIAEQEVDYALWLARTLTRGGHYDQAAPLWKLCTRRSRAASEPRATRARVLRARADAYRLRRRTLRSIGLRLLAAALEARSVSGRLRRATSLTT
jgi:glycosyltransferase involved in cell wall biosynthesis